MMLMLNLTKYTGNPKDSSPEKILNNSIIFSDIKNNRIQTYTDQDLTFVVPKGSVECFGIETEQLEDVDKGYKNFFPQSDLRYIIYKEVI